MTQPAPKTLPLVASSIKTTTLQPLHENVFVTDIDEGVKLTRGGLIIPDDNMSNRGVRPRWARVFAIGPEVVDLEVGEWVLIEHGRWTNRISLDLPDGPVDVWRIDYPAAVLAVSDKDERLSQTTL